MLLISAAYYHLERYRVGHRIEQHLGMPTGFSVDRTDVLGPRSTSEHSILPSDASHPIVTVLGRAV
jgi:hypothetical protein